MIWDMMSKKQTNNNEVSEISDMEMQQTNNNNDILEISETLGWGAIWMGGRPQAH